MNADRTPSLKDVALMVGTSAEEHGHHLRIKPFRTNSTKRTKNASYQGEQGSSHGAQHSVGSHGAQSSHCRTVGGGS